MALPDPRCNPPNPCRLLLLGFTELPLLRSCSSEILLRRRSVGVGRLDPRLRAIEVEAKGRVLASFERAQRGLVE